MKENISYNYPNTTENFYKANQTPSLYSESNISSNKMFTYADMLDRLTSKSNELVQFRRFRVLTSKKDKLQYGHNKIKNSRPTTSIKEKKFYQIGVKPSTSISENKFSTKSKIRLKAETFNYNKVPISYISENSLFPQNLLPASSKSNEVDLDDKSNNVTWLHNINENIDKCDVFELKSTIQKNFNKYKSLYNNYKILNEKNESSKVLNHFKKLNYYYDNAHKSSNWFTTSKKIPSFVQEKSFLDCEYPSQVKKNQNLSMWKKSSNFFLS